jgi:hypothetical protein
MNRVRVGTLAAAAFLLHDGKRIERAVAVDAERSRKLRCGAPVVRVKGRVTFFTARRTDTSVMIVCHGNTSADSLRRQIFLFGDWYLVVSTW